MVALFFKLKQMENKMKYLSLSWFKSKIEKGVETAIEKVVTKKVENLVEELSNQEVLIKPYHSSIQVNDTLTVVLNNGQVLTKQNVEIEKLGECKTEDDVIKLMSTKEVVQEKEKQEEVKKEIELIVSNFDILVQTGDFEVKDNSVYLKGINRSVPKLLINKFANICLEYNKDTYGTDAHFSQLLDEDIEYQSLIRFWKKCCLNPNAQSAEDLYEFLEHHNMKIDQHGNFYAYRRVEKAGSKNTELVDFISNAYNKVKGIWKKKSEDYQVIFNNDTYSITKNLAGSGKFIGNLKDLYLNLPNMQENRYTSAHTGLEDYRVGNVISMPRDEGDDDNTRNCSFGYHAASKQYDYSNFGNQDILVIINPMDVLAVPRGEVGKLRTCRWYFAMTLEENERYILDEDCFDVTHLGDIFEEKCLENLEEHVKKGFTEEVKRHTFTIPNISANEITTICKSLTDIQEELKDRVVNI